MKLGYIIREKKITVQEIENMENFNIKGRFKAGRSWEQFTKKVTSQNEKNAKEKVFSLLGSEHGIKRNFIQLDSITRE